MSQNETNNKMNASAKGDEEAINLRPSASAPSILVVDDERMNLAILSRLLEQQGFRTTCAPSGTEALEYLSEQPFDLVLLDYIMPDMDGSEVLRLIRRDRDPFELPVVMLTATDDRKLVVSMFEFGANDFIIKPFDPEVLVARVDVQLRLKTALAAVRRSEERYELAARATNDGLWDWDPIRDQLYYSPRWNRIIGLDEVEVVGGPEIWLNRVHPDDLARLNMTIQRYINGSSPKLDTEFRMRHEDGNYRWVVSRGMALRDSSGRILRMAGSMSDITGGKVADLLTGLPNRLLFTERVKRSFDEFHKNPETRCAVLYLDLDNFKYINDTFGHDAGDRVLINAARRLESVIRTDEAVAARFGGDEFAVLLEAIPDISVAVTVAERIREALATPLTFQGREVYTQVSVGIAMIDSEMTTVDELLRHADMAMYDAKSSGKSQTSVFNPTMRARSEARFKLETELRQAIARQEFVLHYQPILEMATSQMVAMEAVVRWQHPTLGLLSSEKFIPLAEEIGIIIPLGNWVMMEACKMLSQWKKVFPHLERLAVSINISGKQLAQENFAESALQTIKNSGLDGNSVQLELTESVIMKDPEYTTTLLQHLRQQGVKIAVDDFGTGFSSLAYLHQLPLDILKIDREFVHRMNDTDHGAAIVRTILSLAENLSLDAVALGIESNCQYVELKNLGCQYGQGYWLSPPISSDDMTLLLQSLDETGRMELSLNHETPAMSWPD